MAVGTKIKFSGSTNGRNIKVAATATAGTLIHTATSSTDVVDAIHLWAVNSDTVSRKLTVEFGGVTSPDDLIEQTIPPESGLYLIICGLVLDGGVVCRAFCETANVVSVNGYVNRISNA